MGLLLELKTNLWDGFFVGGDIVFLRYWPAIETELSHLKVIVYFMVINFDHYVSMIFENIENYVIYLEHSKFLVCLSSQYLNLKWLF